MLTIPADIGNTIPEDGCIDAEEQDHTSPVILSVAKDQVGRRESTTLGMLAVLGTLLPELGESNMGADPSL
ncbi:MAG TPA: hypothetical protein VND68_09580, partial [Chloroflexia bacterium]|nr:hypothetical protein [Chloroflexia bacterium]